MEDSDATDRGRNVEAAVLAPSHCRFVTKRKQGCERVDVTSVAGTNSAFHALMTIPAQLIWTDNGLEKACLKCLPLNQLQGYEKNKLIVIRYLVSDLRTR